MRWVAKLMLALTTLAMPVTAQAERLDTPFFQTTAVDDAVLAEARGGQSPFASLTVGSTARLLDAQAQADLRQTGTIGRITMDVWWGTIGAELIATSVRAAGAP